jgi:hypothetical protein
MKIQSPLGIEECMSVLKSATVNESLLGTMFLHSGTIICKLKGDTFRLRQQKSYRNSFSPYFYGKFRQTENGTEISGDFRMHPSVVAFTALWFGFLILIGGTIVVTSLTQWITGHYDHARNANPLMGIFIPLVMVIFGIALVKFCTWLGKSEEAKMTSFLQEKFANRLDLSSAAFTEPSSPPKISMVLPILFFAFLGLLSLVSSFSGIASYQTTASSETVPHATTVITHYRDQWGRWLALANGIFLCLVAYGVWKRLHLVWKLGFALFALSAVDFVFNVLCDSKAFPRASGESFLVFVIPASVAATAVGAFWTVWWYKKRDYFTE